MPLLITYRGRPVKRRRRCGTGLCLTMSNTSPGLRSDQLFVTDAEWSHHGRVQYFPGGLMPNVCELARHTVTTPRI